MTENETFDPVRSAAIRRMLVRTAAQSAAAPRERTKRIALITSLVVAAVVLAGGSTAWALGVRPFPVVAPTHAPTHTPAPTPTPSVTPTVTPTPVQSFDPPVSKIGLGCLALASRSPLATLVPAFTLSNMAVSNPDEAALRETGAESCFWSGDGYSILTLDISTRAAAGRADVAAGIAHGYGSVGVGDASSAECEKVSTGCAASVVAGPYWYNFEFQNTKSHTRLPNAMVAVMKSMVAQLRTQPPSSSSWKAPTSSWSSTTRCSDLRTSRPLSQVLGSPPLSAPKSFAQGSEGGIDFSVPRNVDCQWSLAGNHSISGRGFRGVIVNLAPGARWAYEIAAKSTAKPVKVVGADAAVMHCYTGDGDVCVLDVLSDNSWLQVSLAESLNDVAGQSKQLIAVANALLAGHARN